MNSSVPGQNDPQFRRHDRYGGEMLCTERTDPYLSETLHDTQVVAAIIVRVPCEPIPRRDHLARVEATTIFRRQSAVYSKRAA